MAAAAGSKEKPAQEARRAASTESGVQTAAAEADRSAAVSADAGVHGVQLRTGEEATAQRASALASDKVATSKGVGNLQHIPADGLADGAAAAGVADQQARSNAGLQQAGLSRYRQIGLVDLTKGTAREGQRDAAATAFAESAAATSQQAASSRLDRTHSGETADASLQQAGERLPSQTDQLRARGKVSTRLGKRT